MKMATTETLPAASSMLSRGPVDTAQSHGRVRSANYSYSSRSNSRAGLYSRSNLRQQHQQQRYTNGNEEVVEDDVVVQPMLERNVKTHTGKKQDFSIDTRRNLFVNFCFWRDQRLWTLSSTPMRNPGFFTVAAFYSSFYQQVGLLSSYPTFAQQWFLVHFRTKPVGEAAQGGSRRLLRVLWEVQRGGDHPAEEDGDRDLETGCQSLQVRRKHEEVHHDTDRLPLLPSRISGRRAGLPPNQGHGWPQKEPT